jgi:hypothetical protein
MRMSALYKISAPCHVDDAKRNAQPEGAAAMKRPIRKQRSILWENCGLLGDLWEDLLTRHKLRGVSNFGGYQPIADAVSRVLPHESWS